VPDGARLKEAVALHPTPNPSPGEIGHRGDALKPGEGKVFKEAGGGKPPASLRFSTPSRSTLEGFPHAPLGAGVARRPERGEAESLTMLGGLLRQTCERRD
jgi:hypothetical protein